MLVPEEIRQCVVFLCYRIGEQVRLAGTGFFVSVPTGFGERIYVYLITARHVIEGISDRSTDGKVLVRINTVAGGVELIESDLDAWSFHPDEEKADVAVISAAPSRSRFEYRTIPRAMFATQEAVNEHGIGLGDELFFPGLFVNHYGQNRNLPIMRLGNIAGMPEEPVITSWRGQMEAYLVEGRSIGGLSGSPVFVHLVLGRGGNINLSSPRFFLLGLMHGHYDASLTDADEMIADDAQFDQVNMGIAIVAPAQKIAEMLDQKSLVDERARNDELLRRQNQGTPD